MSCPICGGSGKAADGRGTLQAVRRCAAASCVAVALELQDMGFAKSTIMAVVAQEVDFARAITRALEMEEAATAGADCTATASEGVGSSAELRMPHATPASTAGSAEGSPEVIPNALCECGRIRSRNGGRLRASCCVHCPASHTDDCQRRERRRRHPEPRPPAGSP